MVQSLLSDIYQKLGDLTEVPGGLESARFKQVITKWACEYEVGDCSNKAVQLFKEWMASSNNSWVYTSVSQTFKSHGYLKFKEVSAVHLPGGLGV